MEVLLAVNLSLILCVWLEPADKLVHGPLRVKQNIRLTNILKHTQKKKMHEDSGFTFCLIFTLTVLLKSPRLSAISFVVMTAAKGYPFPIGFPIVTISGTTSTQEEEKKRGQDKQECVQHKHFYLFLCSLFPFYDSG